MVGQGVKGQQRCQVCRLEPPRRCAVAPSSTRNLPLPLLSPRSRPRPIYPFTLSRPNPPPPLSARPLSLSSARFVAFDPRSAKARAPSRQAARSASEEGWTSEGGVSVGRTTRARSLARFLASERHARARSFGMAMLESGFRARSYARARSPRMYERRPPPLPSRPPTPPRASLQPPFRPPLNPSSPPPPLAPATDASAVLLVRGVSKSISSHHRLDSTRVLSSNTFEPPFGIYACPAAIYSVAMARPHSPPGLGCSINRGEVAVIAGGREGWKLRRSRGGRRNEWKGRRSGTRMGLSQNGSSFESGRDDTDKRVRMIFSQEVVQARGRLRKSCFPYERGH